MALEDRRRRVHRAEAHLRRVEAGPFASRRCARWASGRVFFTASSEARISQAAPSVICELLPGVTLPYLRSKKGFSLARFCDRGVAPHAVVERVGVALGVVERLDLAAAGRERALRLAHE